MHIAITGAAGFLGQRLAQQLIQRGELRQQSITQLTLIDQVEAPSPQQARLLWCREQWILLSRTH